MGSTFAGLEVGKRSLFAQQAALNTINHNIANANTPGYSRQRVNMEATVAFPAPSLNNDRSPGQIGTGVFVSEITRLREQYLDRQYRDENMNLGYWSGKSDTLEKVETILSEPSDSGLQNVLDKFWESWQDVSKNPENLAARQVALQRGLTVTETFHQLSSSLQSLKSDSTAVITDKVNEVNSYAEQIRNLNEQIMNIEPHGYSANDLFDQRDLILDKLSKLGNITVTPSNAGMINVSIGGQQVVTGKEPVQKLADASTITGGELFAIRQSIESGGVIDSYLTNLNSMAQSLGTEINNLHIQGFNLDGETGRPFFSNVSDAASLTIDSMVLAAPHKVAAGAQPLEGDGDIAGSIAKLKFSSFAALGNDVTLDQYHRLAIARLGIETQESQRFMGNSDAALLAIENKRQSISGVSLDEEMTDMVKYQHAYNAASRSINAMDELLDKLINGTGRVGL